jgi:lysophospholipase L1-like esterase
LRRALLALTATLINLLLVVVAGATPARAIINGADSTTLAGQVQFWVKGGYVCTGTLIHVKWVLTAKHCINNSEATTANSFILLGDRRMGEGQSHPIEGFHLSTDTDAALIELAAASNQPNLVVGYGLGVPALRTNVSIRGWGRIADGTLAKVLQVATMRVSDTQFGDVACGPAGSCVQYVDIGAGYTAAGDSGAGVHAGGKIYAVHSAGTGGTGIGVKTDWLAPWIQQVSGVTPAGEAAATSLRIMPLGDSITDGFQSSTGNGYREPLLAALKAQGHTVDLVGSRRAGTMADPDNEGYSGYRIDQLMSVASSAGSGFRPNVVTLHIGTNDMDRNYQAATAPDRLGALIDAVHGAAPDAVIVVASLVPSKSSVVQARINDFNRRVPDVVKQRQDKGQHVWFVDMGDVRADQLADTLHPNDSGYATMGRVFDDGIIGAIRAGWISDPVPPTAGSCTDNAGRWIDKGVVATGVDLPAQQVRLADINGDGRADYLGMNADTGGVKAWINGGAVASAENGWLWTERGTIATGVGSPSSKVRFADLNGDRRSDYIVVDPATGSLTVWINGGASVSAPNGWLWINQGTIATGVGADPSTTDLVLADIDGDRRADYLSVNITSGAVDAWLNQGANSAAPNGWMWVHQGVVATGVGADGLTSHVDFGMVNCDARADYLVVSGESGSPVDAWINGGAAAGAPNGWLWIKRGRIASGVADTSPETQVVFADLDLDGRDDYLLMSAGGAIRAYLNKGGDPG